MVKLFDVLEVVKNLKNGDCARQVNWPVDHYIRNIRNIFLYQTPVFTTEYKFGPQDFDATWETYEPIE
jgi:hypothetical protein